ncbi:MAG: Type 1 glutamine amidotransferase-like domain-containing protein [Patescibacteria group bacterium]
MKKLFLTSQFYKVAEKLVTLVPDVNGQKVAFITTAADTYTEKPWMDADREKLKEMGFEVEDYNIKEKTKDELYEYLKSKDVIFVSGGNTFYLLDHVRKSGFDSVISRLLDEGKIYIGSSAGSMIMSSDIEPSKLLDKPELAPDLTSFLGLGLVDSVILPHYGNPKYEERYKNIINDWSNKIKLQLLTDDQVILIEGDSQKII